MHKLALGTVQFGLNYGVTNQNGQVPIAKVKNILQIAKDNNINTLDTASNYGDSEKVLGSVGVGDFQVITKTVSINNGVNEVVKQFHQSLNCLNREYIDGLLIHDINEIENKEFNVLFGKLGKLKQQGLINKIGFSTYTPEQVDFLLNNFEFDLIQVPFNVFDDRLLQGGQLQALSDKGIEVHARSVFLQGLLLDFGVLPEYFLSWENEFSTYQKVVKKSGLSLLEYALNFALGIKELDKVLVGINNARQLQSIIKASESKLENKCLAYSIDDIKLLNPSLWKI